MSSKDRLEMEEQKNTEKLAGIVIQILAAALIIALCWYFRSTLIYIIVAAVVSLMCRPLARGLKMLSIKGRTLPPWIIAIFSMALVTALFVYIVTRLVPIAGNIIQNVSDSLHEMTFDSYAVTKWFDDVNMWLIDRIPKLGRGFRIQDEISQWMGGLVDIDKITSVVGSVVSLIGSIGIGIFSVVFIAFFFVKDESLFRRIICSLVPDDIEKDAEVAVGEIERLLTRYFGGLVLEVSGVALLDFLGLWLVAGMDINSALGIAFMAGILNIIPYVGPWIGTAVGTLTGTVIKLSSGAAAIAMTSIWPVAVTLLGVFVLTQVVDNFVFQPMIYSTSIKSTPLEVFIVLLMAAHIGGIVGMLVAIPSYTVIRVVASRFLRGIKPIRRLMEATDRK